MSNTRNLADLLDSSGDIKSAALDNVDVSGKLDTSGGTLTGTLTMESTDAGSTAAPELILYRNSASPADGDYLGQVQFKGENDNGGSEIYAKVTGKITDASNGTEDGLIETAIKGNGSFTIVSRQKSDELQLLNGVNLNVDGSVTATGYTGSGANLTSLPAAQLTGTIAADRLSTATTQSASDNSTKIATTAYTDAQVATVVDSAPGTLNTLNELAAALGDDANFSTTVTNSIAAKLPLAGGTMTGDLIISEATPILRLNDTDTNTPFEVRTEGGSFIINDVNNDRDLFTATTGHAITIGNGAGGNITLNTTANTIIPNGNVGIGTSSISSYHSGADNLVVYASGSSGITIATGDTTSTVALKFADGTDSTSENVGYIDYAHSDNSMRFGTTATERMRIDSSGKVSIGTAGVESAGPVMAVTDWNQSDNSGGDFPQTKESLLGTAYRSHAVSRGKQYGNGTWYNILGVHDSTGSWIDYKIVGVNITELYAQHGASNSANGSSSTWKIQVSYDNGKTFTTKSSMTFSAGGNTDSATWDPADDCDNNWDNFRSGPIIIRFSMSGTSSPTLIGWKRMQIKVKADQWNFVPRGNWAAEGTWEGGADQAITSTWTSWQKVYIPVEGKYLITSNYRVKRDNTAVGFMAARVSWENLAGSTVTSDVRMLEERVSFNAFHNIGGSVNWVIDVESPQYLYIQFFSNAGSSAHSMYNDSNGRPYPVAQYIGEVNYNETTV